MPIINWALKEVNPRLEIIPFWPDLGRLRKPPKLSDLEGRITAALEQAECDVLFVHRDAERISRSERKAEIEVAWERLKDTYPGQTLVCIVPVRMTEAWLMFDEQAIRKAANNPNGSVPIRLPPATKIERLPDPKKELKMILRISSGLRGRDLSKFADSRAVHLVAEYTNDFSFLRQLEAFGAFEAELRRLSATLGIA